MKPQPLANLVLTVNVKQELAPIERKLSETIEERELTNALQGKRVIDAEEAELKDCLKYIYLLIGLRPQNYPDGGEKEFLHRYIAQNWGGHRLAEIRLAFDMAVQGRLNLDQRDVNCYENFSVMYFGRIMAAYRAHALETQRQIQGKPIAYLPTPAPTMFQLACWKLDVIRLTIFYEKPKVKPLLTINQFYVNRQQQQQGAGPKGDE